MCSSCCRYRESSYISAPLVADTKALTVADIEEPT